MDGIELTAALKADHRTSHIPVVLLTAKAAVENRIEGFESGADAYLAKPFDAEELIVRVRTLIEKRRRLRAYYARQMSSGDSMPSDDTTISVTPTLPKREAEFLDNLRELISDNLSDPQFGVDALGELLFMSRRQLLRKLRALIDESPADLIRRTRLDRAATLLREEGLSVKETAHTVGFANERSFSRAFQQKFGTSPSAYGHNNS